MTNTTPTPDGLPELPAQVSTLDAWVTRDYGRKTSNETLDSDGEYYTADQMRAYGLACIAQAAPAGDAVAVLRAALTDCRNLHIEQTFAFQRDD